jgi:tetratricopeptide (TPR) repeat protein
MVPQGSEFCPHCGAPLSRTTGNEGSDKAVYPKLAQANLLRMRRQYKEAEDMCISILHQFPHNVSANTLLGDIAAERGDVEQSAEWYELALDIDENAAGVKEKLGAVRQVKENKQVVDTAEQLGLPTTKPKTALIAIIAVVVLLVIFVGAYYASQAGEHTGATPQTEVDKPVIVNDSTGGGQAPPKPPSTTGNVISGSEEDQELTKLIGGKASGGEFLLGASYTMANESLTLTYSVPDDKNERDIGVSLATQAFALVKDNLKKDVSQVVLRAMRDAKQYYSAIVKKDDFDVTQTAEWQTAHKDDPLALAKAILSNEKYANAKPAETTSDTGGTTGATTDETSGGTAGTTESTTGGTKNPPPPATTGVDTNPGPDKPATGTTGGL